MRASEGAARGRPSAPTQSDVGGVPDVANQRLKGFLAAMSGISRGANIARQSPPPGSNRSSGPTRW